MALTLPPDWSVCTVPACPPGAARPEVLPVAVPPGARWFRHGWQSWSASSWTATTAGPVPSRGGPAAAPRHPWWWLGEPAAATGYGLLVADGATVCVLDPVSVALTPHPCHGEVGVATDPADRATEVRIAVRTDLTAAQGLAAVPELLARGAPGVAPHAGAPGWSSWTAFFERIDADLLQRQLTAAAGWNRAGATISRFAVDDGYQAALGDWCEVRDGFGTSLPDLARRITDAGMVPGLWLSPLLVAPASRVATRHPSWLLRDGDGDPVVAIRVAHWGGPAYVLDVTRDDVVAHLHAVATRLRSWGWRHLKLDFLYAAALPGRHREPAVGPARRLRRALAALRAGAESVGDVHLTGCGAPLWEARGLVDAMRVGPDVLRRWSPAGCSGLPARHEASLRSTWRCAHARAFLHGAAWANDPDSVLLAAEPGAGRRGRSRPGPDRPAKAGELAAWRRWVADRGQVLTCSDDLTALPAGVREEWAATVARRARAETRDTAAAVA